jgi:hypothetical protein
MDIDWRIACGGGFPVLIVGGPDSLEHSLLLLTPHLARPVCYWSGDGPLPSAVKVKTLVVRHVDRLVPRRQLDLMGWLDEAARAGARVVSTTSISLVDRVSAGLFLDALYYRLNTMVLAAADAAVID